MHKYNKIIHLYAVFFPLSFFVKYGDPKEGVGMFGSLFCWRNNEMVFQMAGLSDWPSG